MAVALACALGQIGLPAAALGFHITMKSGGMPVGKGPVLGQIPARPKAVLAVRRTLEGQPCRSGGAYG